ncbi:MAG: uncharacterized protein KVP18_001614 [Porospora cf. gigantea A]|uniref:uncharacterized protein n=1 Tax=Porospora cf. gigantea A TaxID=2853593 RepID=UPI003559BED8|nr:MAG: hypothetical protein KVP18_001614 [Porospora cf. gigantea A]
MSSLTFVVAGNANQRLLQDHVSDFVRELFLVIEYRGGTSGLGALVRDWAALLVELETMADCFVIPVCVDDQQATATALTGFVQLRRLPWTHTMHKADIEPSELEAEIAKPRRVAIGGTFDHLHVGHQLLLLEAILAASRGSLTIGVTSEKMLQRKKHRAFLEPFAERCRRVRLYTQLVASCTLQDPELHVEQLHHSLDIAGTRREFDLLVVSEETAEGIQSVNALRETNSFNPLQGVIVPELSTVQGKMSSTDKRRFLQEICVKFGLGGYEDFSDLTCIEPHLLALQSGFTRVRQCLEAAIKSKDPESLSVFARTFDLSSELRKSP